jgi:cytochrome c-type biogenesis protein CcmH
LTAVRATAVLSLLWLLPLAAEDSPVRRIQKRFLAPCCWQQNVADHNSEAASQMRAEIVRMVAAGKSEDQIVEYYVAQYGERILCEPRGAKFAVSILVPVVVLAAAAIWLVGYIRRQRAMPAFDADAAHPPAFPETDLD